MKKFLSYAAVAACAMALVFTSCNKDNGKEKAKPLTPAESQQKMENIGIALAAEINAADFQEIVDVINDFSTFAETLPNDVFATRSTANALKKVITKNDMNALVRAMTAQRKAVPDEYYSQYYKTYTYNGNTGEWDESPNSSALEFVFTSNGKKASLSASVSKEFYTVIADGETVYIPKTSSLSMKYNGSEQLSFVVNVPAFSTTSNKVNATLSAVKAGLAWVSEVDLATNNSSLAVAVKKGSKTLISGKASLNTKLDLPGDGTNLNDYAENVDNTDIPGKTVLDMNVMDQLFVRAECSNVKEFSDEISRLEDTYSYEEEYYKGVKAAYEKYMKFYFSYQSDMSVKEGDFYYDYFYRTTTDYGATYTEAGVIFGIQFADGSKHNAEDFFTENAFSDLIDALEKLITDFENLAN